MVMKIKKFSLGRGLIEMSSLLVNQANVPLKQKRRCKPNPVMTEEERLRDLRAFIEKLGRVTRYGIKKHFGWGNGIVERLHRDLMTVFDDEISWDPKKQTYYWIANQKEQLKLEEVSE